MKKVLLFLIFSLTFFISAICQEGSGEGSEGSHSHEGHDHAHEHEIAVLSVDLPALSEEDFLFHKKACRALEDLVVLHGGRYKPLTALAKEFSWALTPSSKAHFLSQNEERIVVKKTDPLALFLDITFQPDLWETVPVLPVGDVELQHITGLAQSARQQFPYLSLSEFILLMQENSKFHNLVRINIDKMQLSGPEGEAQSSLDDKTRQLINAAEWVQVALTGDLLMIFPNVADAESSWFTMQEVLGLNAQGEKFDQLSGVWAQLGEAWKSKNLEGFQQAATQLKDFQLELIQKLPNTSDILGRTQLEARYWSSRPFMNGAFLSFFSLLLLLPALGAQGRWKSSLLVAGFVALLGAASVIAWGFWMRSTIADRGPIHSIYETAVYATMGIMFFSLILELFSRRGLALVVGATLGVLGGICTSKLGARMDPNFQHVMPVLRSGWLVVHVQVIILGYAAALLSAGLGHAILISRLWLKRSSESVKVLENLCYRSVQFTVLFLTSGILLGAWWANESWGRYWGWDPKETWALISLLIFLALVHFRYSGVVRQLGMASLSIIGGMMVIFCWWGVNYVLGVGLHAYATGFSEKMAKPAVIYYSIEIFFLAWALSKYLEDRSLMKAGPTSS